MAKYVYVSKGILDSTLRHMLVSFGGFEGVERFLRIVSGLSNSTERVEKLKIRQSQQSSQPLEVEPIALQVLPDNPEQEQPAHDCVCQSKRV
jgi:hypothetical protein